MKQKLFISGAAGTLALVALIVALALAASHATAPGRAEVSNGGVAAAPAVQSAGTSDPSEPSDPSVCGMPGADPGNCSY